MGVLQKAKNKGFGCVPPSIYDRGMDFLGEKIILSYIEESPA